MPSKAASREPLRVALDTTYAGVNPTGVGLYSARLTAELKMQALETGLDVLCYGPACEPDGPRNSLRGTMQEWPTYTHGVLPIRLLAARPRIVHATSHIGPLWGPGKLIVTVHDLIFMSYPGDYRRDWLLLTRAFLPAVLRRANAIVADSQATKDDLTRLFGVRASKIVVIYPGIDKPEPAGEALVGPHPRLLQDGGPYVLCLGPWVRRKNLEVVLKAFGLVAAQHPNVQLVVTGDTPRGMAGYTREELISAVPGEYRSRVHLAGYVTQREKAALLVNAALLCYPSRVEGFGLPPLEAMAAGVPVVAANSPAVAEVSGGAALIASPDDHTQWAHAILRVLEEPGLAQALRQAGFARAASFSWERCAQQAARLYWAVAD